MPMIEKVWCDDKIMLQKFLSRNTPTDLHDYENQYAFRGYVTIKGRGLTNRCAAS